jgi:signal transduction histidine kinase
MSEKERFLEPRMAPSGNLRPPFRILVVDDEDNARNLNTRLLTRAGYEVVGALDGAAAWEAIQAQPFDLLITDNAMPKMSGIDLVIKLYDAGKNLPIVFATGAFPDFQFEHYPWLKGIPILTKPLNNSQLLAVVQKILNKGKDIPAETVDPKESAANRGEDFETEAVSKLHLRIENAEARSDRAEERSDKAEARSDGAEARSDEAAARSDRAEARSAAAETINAAALRSSEVRYRELEAFSGAVSHDLHAPLRQLKGYLSVLREDTGQEFSEKNLGILTMISQATKRMENLIEDLLSFSRAGKSSIEKRVVNLNELVQETLIDYSAETKDRQIQWIIHPLGAVEADRGLLRLVFGSLISNAVKFTSARSEAKIEIGCLPDGNAEEIIFVRDNGAGFDPNQKDKLFGVFQRLHSQEEFEGTGLGLANIQRIILRHGGKVWAEGAIDAGATFYFSLPKRTD